HAFGHWHRHKSNMPMHLQICSYDPGWALEFEAERDRIARALGALARRDFLREHSDVAHEYGSLKRHLAAGCDETESSSRESYANAKTAFIERVVQTALAAGYPREAV